MLPDGFYTARLVLRPVGPQDAGPIFDTYAQDCEVTRFFTWRPHKERQETDAYIAHCTATPPQVARTYILVDQTNQMLRGALDLRQADRHHLQFGYVLARACWGQGLMTEVLTGIVTWALAQASIFRISSVCNVENLGSARVMEKSGLIREGLLRRWLVHPNVSNVPRDCFSYAQVK